jgi:hypothetical protein
MNGEKRKLAGIKRDKRKRGKSELFPLTKVNIKFDRTIRSIERAVELLYRRI